MWETIKNNKDEYMVERPKYLCYNIIIKNDCLGAKFRIGMCQTTILEWSSESEMN